MKLRQWLLSCLAILLGATFILTSLISGSALGNHGVGPGKSTNVWSDPSESQRALGGN
jgi:hypothetical protein